MIATEKCCRNGFPFCHFSVLVQTSRLPGSWAKFGVLSVGGGVFPPFLGSPVVSSPEPESQAFPLPPSVPLEDSRNQRQGSSVLRMNGRM